jgi:hypothetical protein
MFVRRCRPTHASRFPTSVLVALVVGAAFMWPTAALAHLDRGRGYSYRTDDCRNGAVDNGWADPITVVMTGSGADSVSRVQFIIDWIVRWKKRTLEDTQFYWDHGSCAGNNVSGADHPVFTIPGGVRKASRWHVRGRFQGGHAKGHNWTVLTPHRDVWQNEYYDNHNPPRLHCHGRDVGPVHPHGNHYVHRNAGRGSGFDRGREEFVARKRLGLFLTSRQPWGNDQTIKQCNGQKAGSNGYVAYVTVPR